MCAAATGAPAITKPFPYGDGQYPDFAALTADGVFQAWSQDLFEALLQAEIETLKEGGDA